MLLAALFVFATVAGVQIALRDRGASVPAVSAVDDGVVGLRGIGEHGAARIATVVPTFEAGSHPRTKFGGSTDGSSDVRDPALQATITRIEQAR